MPRALQQRSQETRRDLLAAGIDSFASVGFDGTSIRALEDAADVQRSAVSYHFGDKRAFWTACIDELQHRFDAHFSPLDRTAPDLDQPTALRMAITAFVRYSAENPQLNRIVAQEGATPSWRLTYLIESFVSHRLKWLGDLTGVKPDPHAYYILMGAAAFVFSVPQECRGLFDIEPVTDDFIRRHAAIVADMMLPMLAAQQNGSLPDE